MSLAAQGLIRGLVQRLLPAINSDSTNSDVAVRLSSYGEVYDQPLVRKAHNLADEGSYFTVTNNQTAIAPAYNVNFTATAPYYLIYNGNATQRLYLDYIALTANVTGACTTTQGFTAAAVVTDSGNRYSSGGTALTANIVNPNFLSSNAPSGILMYAGAITASAASAGARTVVGIRNIRPGVSTTVINASGDMHLINFGSVEGAVGTISSLANANILPQAFPPVVVPPSSSMLFYINYFGMASPSAATYFIEAGFWVR